MSKKKPTKKSPSTGTEKLRKEALATTSANLARLEAKEQSEKSAKTSSAKPKSEKPKKGKRMSGLDAAAKVLVESKEPLGCSDIVKTAGEKGYWKSPGGKTPAATLHAAISREIKEKGKDSRFKKVDRGMFTANK